MSNRISFIRTKFEDYEGTMFGFRTYDDYESGYDNTFPFPMPDDDRLFMKTIINTGNEAALALIDFAKESDKGAFVDGTFYDAEAFAALVEGL